MYTESHKITTFNTHPPRLHIIKNIDFGIVFKKNPGILEQKLPK